MTEKEHNSEPDILHGTEAGAQEKEMRVQMGVKIADLLMKVGFGEVTDEEARTNLTTILATWQGATDMDKTEAWEELEETLAYRQSQVDNPPPALNS